MATFEVDIAKFAAKANGRVETVFRKVGLEMFSRIVKRSPVGNPSLWKHKGPKGYVGGRFRANWQVRIGRPAAGALDLKDRTGSATIIKGAEVIQNVRADETLWFVNSLPYARALEFGWSKQAPAGMVRVTIAEFQSIVGNAAKKE